MCRVFARHLAGWISAGICGRRRERAEHFCMMAYVIGYARESHRRNRVPAVPASTITAH
jgi:hypothetical protein